MHSSLVGVACAPVIAVLLLACGSHSSPGQPPPGYVEVPGTPDVFLNPAHQGAVGSQFSQQCNDANPDPPGPGEVGWHFILPQSVEEFLRGASPGNVFQTLRVTFATAGSVTLTVFGPPSDAHAYFTTPTDDTLVSGNADIFREVSLLRGNDPNFNLSHTCAPADQTTTTSSSTTMTTSTTTTTTTEPSTTTTTEPTTTIEPTPTVTGPTTTTDPTATTTSTTPTTLGPSTSIAGGGGTNATTTIDPGGSEGATTPPAIPVTGNTDGRLPLAALFVVSLGVGLVIVARRSQSSS